MKAITESQLWKKRLGDWVLNPYIGCEHGCYHCYCPAMPGVKFFNEERKQTEWGNYLIPKPGFVDALKQQLRTFTPDKAKRTEWGDGWLLMSFLTDCYTPTEGKLKVTRECLKLLLEAGHKVRVQTRSALVERDFDILKAHGDRVLLGTSLPYLDDDLARVLEPKASSPSRRLVMLYRAESVGIPIYAAIAPFMPWPEAILHLGAVAKKLREIPVKQVFCEVLNPKGDNLSMMVNALLDAGYSRDVLTTALKNYDEQRWALCTYRLLTLGIDIHIPNFIPWPDTQRRWAKHLSPEQVAWLDQFLPAKNNAKPEIPSGGSR